MKSAYLLSNDPLFYEKARRSAMAAGSEGWFGCDLTYAGDDVVQVVERGTDHLFTLESREDPSYAIMYQMPPHLPEPGVTMPDLASVIPYGAQCRWEDLFVRLVRAVAEISGEPAWVLDENNVVWDALNVDPDRVHL